MQTYSELSMDRVDKENLDGLLLAGDGLWKENEEMAKKMLRILCDEKFKK